MKHNSPLQRKRKILCLIVALALLSSIIPLSSVKALTVAGAPGQVDINKTAVVSGNREYTVTLTVTGNPLPVKNDILLILDRSASMAWKMANDTNPAPGELSRLQILKAATNSFVDSVLAAGNDNRVAVVAYSGLNENDTPWNDSQTLTGYSSSASAVKASYAGLTASGGTNMQAGFMEADTVLDSARSDANKIVIFMTDGVPTFYYDGSGYTQGPGGSFSTTGRDQAIAQAMALKSHHPATVIDTVGLVINNSDAQVQSVLNPVAPNNYQDAYFQATDATGLNGVYSELAKTITQVATDAVITDIIQDGFTYIPGSLVYPAGTTASVTGSPATKETVTWTVGLVSDTVLTLSFRVFAEDPVYGEAFTNESADISFKPVPENSYYTPGPDGTVDLTFPRPDVPVPPIAVDDSYSVNYGSSLSIAAPGVLANDISADQRSDGGWTSTPISGSVTVVTPPANGALTQNPDGSFIYTPNPGFAGIDTYVYKISTFLTYTSGASVTLEDTAVVTIDVKTQISVAKTWVDEGPGTRPTSITVHLWRNIEGQSAAIVASADVSDPWQYTFVGLDTQDPAGNPYIYSVTEDPVPGYSPNIDGFTIVNTLSGTIDIPVNKHWSDSNDAAGLRPDSVTVHLWRGLASEQSKSEIDSKTLTAPSWTYTFANMPQFDESGHLYVYSISEDAVAGYTTSINRFDITNTLIKHQIQIVKLDQRDEQTKLEGAVFELHAATGTNQQPAVGGLLETLTTDADGLATTTGFYAPGIYFLVETKAPAGFLLLTDPIQINMPVNLTAELFSVNILNNFDNNPGITVNKLAANLTKDSTPAALADLYVGETVRYSVVVVNSGNTSLLDVTLTDDQALVGGTVRNVTSAADLIWTAGVGGIATVNLGTLGAGESVELSYDHVVTAADLAREPIVNTASVTGRMSPAPDYPDGTTVSNDSSATITVEALPLAGIQISKMVQNITRGGALVDLAGGISGDVFRYSITITNSGNVALTQVVLTDDRAVAGGAVRNVTTAADLSWSSGVDGIATLDIGTLAAGESMTFTYEYTSTANDVGDVLVNTAIAQGTVATGQADPQIISVEGQASISVDQIPITGEADSTGLAGLGLLWAAAALFMYRRRLNRREA